MKGYSVESSKFREFKTYILNKEFKIQRVQNSKSSTFEEFKIRRVQRVQKSYTSIFPAGLTTMLPRSDHDDGYFLAFQERVQNKSDIPPLQSARFEKAWDSYCLPRHQTSCSIKQTRVGPYLLHDEDHDHDTKVRFMVLTCLF